MTDPSGDRSVLDHGGRYTNPYMINLNRSKYRHTHTYTHMSEYK